MNRVLWYCCAAIGPALGLFSAGCGGSADEYSVVPVSGTVTCNGEPVPFAALQFMPLAEQGRADGRPGRSAFAVADVMGNFQLTTYEENDGAIVGKHKVTVGISLLEDTSDDPNEGFECVDCNLEVTIDEPTENLQLDFTTPN